MFAADFERMRSIGGQSGEIALARTKTSKQLRIGISSDCLNSAAREIEPKPRTLGKTDKVSMAEASSLRQAVDIRSFRCPIEIELESRTEGAKFEEIKLTSSRVGSMGKTDFDLRMGLVHVDRRATCVEVGRLTIFGRLYGVTKQANSRPRTAESEIEDRGLVRRMILEHFGRGSMDKEAEYADLKFEAVVGGVDRGNLGHSTMSVQAEDCRFPKNVKPELRTCFKLGERDLDRRPVSVQAGRSLIFG